MVVGECCCDYHTMNDVASEHRTVERMMRAAEKLACS